MAWVATCLSIYQLAFSDFIVPSIVSRSFSLLRSVFSKTKMSDVDSLLPNTYEKCRIFETKMVLEVLEVTPF